MRPAGCTRFVHIRAHSTNETRKNCLTLMRTTAQSVSVITTVLPTQATRDALDTTAMGYHGVTLSSFTSVSMYPHPLISFSLRIPSRMADSLRERQLVPQECPRPHLVINLLSACQAHLALQFSRPRGIKDPFASTPYFLSPEGIPVLRNSLGALSCTLVRSIPLEYAGPTKSQKLIGDTSLEQEPKEQGSELFIARVHRVESGSSPESKFIEERLEELDTSTLPLVYHRQQYVTVKLARQLLPSDHNKRIP